MNEENNIEDLFRDKFKNYSPPPPDGLWDKIETKIGAENKKAGFWIFSNFWGKIFSSLFIIAFISAFSAAYFMSKPKVYSNSKKESKIKENVSESSFNLTANENKIFQENKSQKEAEGATNSTSIQKRIDNKQSTKPSEVNNLLSKESELINASDSKSNNNKAEFNSKDNRVDIPPTNNEETSNNLQTFSYSSPLINETDDEINEKEVELIKYLPFPIFLSNQTLSGSLFELETEDKKLNKPSLFVEAYGGPSIAFRRFSSNHSLMFNHKQQAESQLLSYDWGVSVGVIKGNWEFSLGAQVERLGERYNYDGLKEVHDTTVTSHQHPLDPTVMVYDTAVEVHHNHVEHNTNNIYNYLTIPLNIGYQLKLSPKFTLVPTVTTGINILMNAQTSWLDPESLDAVVHSSQDGGDAFRRVNFSNRIQIGLYYGLTDKLSFMVKPEGTILWQSVFTNDQFLNHRPYSFDANFGLRYQF